MVAIVPETKRRLASLPQFETPIPSFSSLPHDIFFEVCERLSDKDVLKLQLLSTNIRQKLPQSRLNLIHAEKTYYLCSHSIRKLEKLVRDPILARRVTNITFDVGVPHVRLRSKRSCAKEARDYPMEARARLNRWSSTHMRRHNSMTPQQARRPSAATREMVPRGPIAYDTVIDQTFNLFKSHYATYVDPADEEKQGDFAIFGRITKVFQKLPSLAVLTFAHTNPKMVERSEMLSLWREYNDHLYSLLYIDPKIELQSGVWPWCSWLKPKTPAFLLSKACPAILFCATQAQRTISEIRIGDTSWGPQNFGLMISKFEPPQVRLKDGNRQGWEKAYYHWICRYVDDYKATFGQLKRFDLCLEPEEQHIQQEEIKTDRRKRETRGKPPPVSLCLLTMLRNVEQLKVWRLRGDPTKKIESQGKGFVIPTDTHLPNLEKLEIGEYSEVALNGLHEFLRTNSNSLRSVSCDMFALKEEIVSKPEIMRFLDSLKETVKLENFKIDILIDQVNETGRKSGQESTSNIYLRIDIRGLWHDQDCEYKIGLRKIPIAGYDDESTSSIHLAKKRGWEEFIGYMSKLDLARITWR